MNVQHGCQHQAMGDTAAAVTPLCVSLLIGVPLLDAEGERVGTVRDIVVRLGTSPWPEVTGLVAQVAGRDVFVPYDQLARLDAAGAQLRELHLSLERFVRRDNELLLFADVMDRQMLDVAGRRLVRVDDLQLLSADGRLRLVGIESGLRPLLRRLLPRVLARHIPPGPVLDWAEAEYLPHQPPVVRLQLPRERLARLRPAELAALLDRLAYPQARAMLDTLSPQVAADALEELAPKRQAHLVEGLEEDRAAAILGAMLPESAADLVEALDPARGERLLQRLPEQVSSSVRDLLHYAPRTAGGVMYPKVATVPQGTSVAEALAALRHPTTPRPRAALFVTDSAGRLVGTVPLGLLLTAEPTTPVETLIDPDIPAVRTDEPAPRLAEIMAESDALELPVVDESGRLVGAVAADEILEVVAPPPQRTGATKAFAT
jgi:magnesium transporter